MKARENILQRLRKATAETTPMPFEGIQSDKGIFEKVEEDLALLFAQRCKTTAAQFSYCENTTDLCQQLSRLSQLKGWRDLHCWSKPLQGIFAEQDLRNCRIGRNLEKANAGVTACEALIARTGSVLLSSRQAGGRELSIFPPVHIVVAKVEQLVYDIKDALALVETKYEALPSMLSITSGPSRTADIEKTLVMGAHGPKELYVFLLEKE